MTDLLNRESSSAPEVPDPSNASRFRVRMALFRATFAKNWKLFAANPIGIIGMVIVGLFGIMAVLQPVLISGWSIPRAVGVALAWLLIVWGAYRTVQSPTGLVAPLVVILSVAAAVVILAGGFTILSVLLTLGAMWALGAVGSKIAGRLPSGLSARPAAAVAAVVAIGLAWAVFSVAGAWDARTYHPVVGYEENPPTLTRMVVNEVTDPETEMSFREAILNDPLAQPGAEITIPLQPAPPDSRHLLGTDPLGRDVLSQLMFGARAAFLLGIVAALVTVVIATSVGAIAAYFGGWVDAFFMRLADLLLMLPALAIFIVVSSVFDFELWHLALFLGLLSGFGGTAIILKSQAMAVKVKPFIDAAKVAGGGWRRIIFTHIVPNVVPLSFLYMMFSVTGAIQTEATLSFLGLMNIDMSWGIMINIAQTQGYLLQGADFWWLLYPAGLSVTLLAAAFFLVGRGMDEVVNPRLRKR